MSKPSRLLTFLDEKNGYSISIFDGRELIAYLATLHHLKGKGFDYFRDSVLTALPMISFFKTGEGFGIYVDSEKPYFRLKIEANASGHMRTLLLPETFTEFPEKISGQGRLTKISNSIPYTSILPLHNLSFNQLVNNILKDSYQVQSEIRLVHNADLSVFIMKLPNINYNKIEASKRPSPAEYWMQHQAAFNVVLGSNPNEETIIDEMKKLGFDYLSGRDIQFNCPCSKERMVLGLKGIKSSTHEELFEPGKDSLTAHCDYCKKDYIITKEDLA